MVSGSLAPVVGVGLRDCSAWPWQSRSHTSALHFRVSSVGALLSRSRVTRSHANASLGREGGDTVHRTLSLLREASLRVKACAACLFAAARFKGALSSPAAGRQTLTAQRVDALLLLADNRLVFRAKVDTKLAAIADTAVRALRRHLPPAPELTPATLKPPEAKPTDAAVLVAIAAAVLLLMSLAVYGQWVISGVVEEKNNRVAELLLTTVPPRDLLAGKVIGIGLLGLAQLALVAGLAAVLLAAGAFHAPESLGGSLALVVPWFALGFALYAVAYAAAGALASRQQNADTAGQPVTYTLLAAYLAGYVALAANSSGLAANVLTVFPRRSFSLPEAHSSACRSGSTRSRSRSCSHPSTRSSGSPDASTRTASSTPAPALAPARPGA